MNVQNKILITLFALGTIFWSCDSLIYDDLADCPQGVYVKFYSMTPCAADSTFLGSVSSLTLFRKFYDLIEFGDEASSTRMADTPVPRRFSAGITGGIKIRQT